MIEWDQTKRKGKKRKEKKKKKLIRSLKNYKYLSIFCFYWGARQFPLEIVLIIDMKIILHTNDKQTETIELTL